MKITQASCYCMYIYVQTYVVQDTLTNDVLQRALNEFLHCEHERHDNHVMLGVTILVCTDVQAEEVGHMTVKGIFISMCTTVPIAKRVET